MNIAFKKKNQWGFVGFTVTVAMIIAPHKGQCRESGLCNKHNDF